MKELEAIKARLAAATPDNQNMGRFRYEHGGGRMHSGRNLILECFDKDNREFYFNALVDMAALIKVYEGAQAEVERLREEMTHGEPY